MARSRSPVRATSTVWRSKAGRRSATRSSRSFARRGLAIDHLVVQVGGGALASSCVQAFAEARALGVLRAHAALPHRPDRGRSSARARLRQGARAAARLAERRRGRLGAARRRRRGGARYMWPWEHEPKSIADGDPRRRDLRLAGGACGACSPPGGSPSSSARSGSLEAHELGHKAGFDVEPTGTAGLAGLVDLLAAGVGATRRARRRPVHRRGALSRDAGLRLPGARRRRSPFAGRPSWSRSIPLRSCTRTCLIADGRVLGVGPAPAGALRRDCSGTVIVPGNVCAHHHLYSALSRGMPYALAPPTNFTEILERIWWRLDRALDEESVRASRVARRPGGPGRGNDHDRRPSRLAELHRRLARGHRRRARRAWSAFACSVTRSPIVTALSAPVRGSRRTGASSPIPAASPGAWWERTPHSPSRTRRSPAVPR